MRKLIEKFKIMKAGYPGKDSMREFAEKIGGAELMGESASPSAGDGAYKKGGACMKKGAGKKVQKLAAGGAAKVRHQQATPSGKAITKIKPLKKGKM